MPPPPKPPQHGNVNVITGHEVTTDPSRATKGTLDWETAREEIRRYYIEEGKTLPETKKLMAENYLFNASLKSYKTKLKEWGFNKHITSSYAFWMLEQARKRKLDNNKATVFKLAGQPISRGQIERSAKRTKVVPNEAINETPPGITYTTPSNGAPSPLDVVQISAAECKRPRWQPENISHSTSVRSQRPRLIWDGRTKAEFDAMQVDAERLEQLEQTEEAEQRYCKALAGLQHLLPPMHADTVTLAYQLCEFYARHDQTKDAYAILQWLTQSHVDRWGLEHRKTLEHMDQTADMLASWHMSSEALSLLHQLWGFDECTRADFTSCSSLIETEDTLGIECELTLCRLGVKHGDTAVKERLEDLAERRRREQQSLSVQAMKSWSLLLDWYNCCDDPIDQSHGCNRAAIAVEELLDSIDKPSMELLEGALELAKTLLNADEYEQGNKLFLNIESRGEECFDNDERFLHVLIAIGKCYQDIERWNDARPFFEHAYSMSICMFGLEHYRTKSLEEGLDREKYTALPAEDWVPRRRFQNLSRTMRRKVVRVLVARAS